MKKLLSLVLILAMVLCASMVTAYANDAGTLVVAQAIDATTMDPQKQGGMSSMNVLINMYDTLVFRDTEGNLIPSLATEWEALDETTWQFRLREGVTFHNGDMFDAEDAKFSLERLINPDTASPIVELAALDHVDIVDDYTINLVLKNPDPIIPNKLVMFGGVMLSKDYTEAHDNDFLAQNPVGTGPYKFASWIKDSEVVMEAYQDHWRGAPAFDKLVFRVVPNQADMLAALKTGEIDMTNSIPYDLAKSVQNEQNIQVVSGPSIRMAFLSIDTAPEPLSKKEVRQAMNYAINREGIIDVLFGGHGSPSGSLIPLQNFGHDETIQSYAYDPEKAMALLAEAGYPDGFELSFDATNTDLTEIQAIVGFLEEIGIKVNMNVVDSSTMTSLRSSGQAGNLYYTTNTGWTMDGMSNYQSFAKSDRRYARGGTPELDELVIAEETNIDPDVRLEAFKKAEAILNDEAFFIFLWQKDNLFAIAKDITYTPNVIGLLWMYDVKPVE